MLMLAFCYTLKIFFFILIQVVILTYVGCTLGPDKSVNHEHDSRCNIVRRETDKCSKQFIEVAIILSQMK